MMPSTSHSRSRPHRSPHLHLHQRPEYRQDSLAEIWSQIEELTTTFNEFKTRDFPGEMADVRQLLVQMQSVSDHSQENRSKSELLREKMDILKAKVDSLELEKASLKKQYQAKDRQYKQLSTAMHDKIHKDGDKTDDELIKKFSALRSEIDRFLLRLFMLGPVEWISAEHCFQDKEDQKSYLGHRIASLVSEHVFGRDGMARGMFGMEQAHEGTLSKLERKFYDDGASEFNIDGWRAQTVQLVRQTKRRVNDRHLKVFTDSFNQDVRRCLQLEAPQEEWLQQGIPLLYAKAIEAALELRERKTRYVWAQAEEVRSTEAFEVDDLSLPLDKGGKAGEQVVLVLFGPLYRVEEDGRRLNIRAGMMLRWTSPA